MLLYLQPRHSYYLTRQFTYNERPVHPVFAYLGLAFACATLYTPLPPYASYLSVASAVYTPTWRYAQRAHSTESCVIQESSGGSLQMLKLTDPLFSTLLPAKPHPMVPWSQQPELDRREFVGRLDPSVSLLSLSMLSSRNLAKGFTPSIAGQELKSLFFRTDLRFMIARLAPPSLPTALDLVPPTYFTSAQGSLGSLSCQSGREMKLDSTPPDQ